MTIGHCFVSLHQYSEEARGPAADPLATQASQAVFLIKDAMLDLHLQLGSRRLAFAVVAAFGPTGIQ